MKFSDAALKLVDSLSEALPRLKAQKAAIHERLKIERQCTATTKTGERCRAWSVWGDPAMKCGRHGGKRSRSPTPANATLINFLIVGAADCAISRRSL